MTAADAVAMPFALNDCTCEPVPYHDIDYVHARDNMIRAPAAVAFPWPGNFRARIPRINNPRRGGAPGKGAGAVTEVLEKADVATAEASGATAPRRGARLR